MEWPYVMHTMARVLRKPFSSLCSQFCMSAIFCQQKINTSNETSLKTSKLMGKRCFGLIHALISGLIRSFYRAAFIVACSNTFWGINLRILFHFITTVFHSVFCLHNCTRMGTTTRQEVEGDKTMSLQSRWCSQSKVHNSDLSNLSPSFVVVPVLEAAVIRQQCLKIFQPIHIRGVAGSPPFRFTFDFVRRSLAAVAKLFYL